MRSTVAEEIRRGQALREAGMSTEDRLRVLQQANAFSIELFASAHDLTRLEAELLLRGCVADDRRREWTRSRGIR